MGFREHFHWHREKEEKAEVQQAIQYDQQLQYQQAQAVKEAQQQQQQALQVQQQQFEQIQHQLEELQQTVSHLNEEVHHQKEELDKEEETRHGLQTTVEQLTQTVQQQKQLLDMLSMDVKNFRETKDSQGNVIKINQSTEQGTEVKVVATDTEVKITTKDEATGQEVGAITIAKTDGKENVKEKDDLANLLRRIEACVNTGGDHSKLVEDWIAIREKRLARWRTGLKAGIAVQTYGLGVVTFGLGPIPINMGIMAGLNKHIVHTFNLDDKRVESFVKTSMGYSASATTKKLALVLAKAAVQAAVQQTAGQVVPLVGPAVSASVSAENIMVSSKETTAKCTEVVREICRDAVAKKKFTM